MEDDDGVYLGHIFYMGGSIISETKKKKKKNKEIVCWTYDSMRVVGIDTFVNCPFAYVHVLVQILYMCIDCVSFAGYMNVGLYNLFLIQYQNNWM